LRARGNPKKLPIDDYFTEPAFGIEPKTS
jgi:hypothetical protein